MRTSERSPRTPAEVRGADGADLLTVSLPGPDESTMLEAAFEEWDWPVRG